MSTLLQASHQWMSRPADERFCSLTEMYEDQVANRDRSTAKAISSRAIECQPIETGDVHDMQVIGPNGVPCAPSNWAFGQLCGLSQAPSAYLRTLPAALAADCVNYGLRFKRDIADVGVLTRQSKIEPGVTELVAATGPNYGRVWNATMIKALIDRFGDGVTGAFRVPGEFGKAVPITKDNTTLYAGDRDMFVFLADEENRIEMPNRRGSLMGSLARGFFVWNSEVGSTSFGVATFLFDYVCCNRMVWGAADYAELRVRHTVSAPDRFIEDWAPAMEAYAKSSTRSITDAVEKARAARIPDVQAFLDKRFNKARAAAILATHVSEEDRPVETVWDAATAITAYARGIPHQDQRVALERQAGKLLSEVAD